MIYQTTDPTKMIETLASLVSKDGGDLSDILVFVPTRRAGRKLEEVLVEKAFGALVLPKIVGLGEGDDDEDALDAISNAERKIILAEILVGIADKVGIAGGFSGALAVASELVALSDYLENDGLDIKSIDWANFVPDVRKAVLMNTIKEIDWGCPTVAAARNRGIENWARGLAKYKKVFCLGSTASVKSTRNLMEQIAKMPSGFVILPGLLENFDDIGRTDPYWSIKQFLAGRMPETIDNGPIDKIRFFNLCFGNDLSGNRLSQPEHITRIDCNTESEEANVAALIAATAKENSESVLIITPDVSGEQRMRSVLSKYNLSVDSSGGTPLSQTNIGRASLLAFDWVLENGNRAVIEKDFSKLADARVLAGLKYNGNLFDFALDSIADVPANAAEATAFLDAVSELSDILKGHNMDLSDVAELFKDAIGSASVRPPMSEKYDVSILGTAEARMQTADVVILTGLADGMFPKDGFRHEWLPRNVSDKIGLPSSDSKVSLMALDFMTLSANKKVYWTQSKMSGGSETVPSRFLSRVGVKTDVKNGAEILAAVRNIDNVSLMPVDTAPPVVKYTGDYYVTWLEDLIHNPYQFYAKHILNLRIRPDIGDEIGAREFGTFVHDVLEKAANIKTEQELVSMLESAALKYVKRESVMFRFWQNRFREFAPEVIKLLNNGAIAVSEKKIQTKYNGRNLIARADRIENGNRVIDYKTGPIPSAAQLGLDKDGNATMPQLAAEAMMLNVPNPTMAFLSLRKKHVGLKEYDAEKTACAIDAVKKKLNIILDIDKFERPEYVDEKYRDFDDLCRAAD